MERAFKHCAHIANYINMQANSLLPDLQPQLICSICFIT